MVSCSCLWAMRGASDYPCVQVVEEFMSIADGQTVMMRERDRQPGPVVAAGELPSTSELRPGTPDAATGTPRQVDTP